MSASQSELIAELLLAVGAGDRRAFRRLYDATSPHLLAILIGRLGHRDAAEDVLQDCYVKIWQSAGSFDPARGPAMAWLSTLVRNKAIDALRARRPEESGPELDAALEMRADPMADPCRDAEAADELLRLRQALTGLPPQMRRSLLLTQHSGYTQEECARMMRAPLGTVKSWVRRGLEQLRNDPTFQGQARAG
ncbi:MAG TPA: sigma-70 family RNA polymerase sigma factor [Solimonas sp.]|nr:sigma-70 family RNA polymerase sigma factor [Solimonas sp.]